MSKYKVNVSGSQIGIVGDDARIEGGIHFHAPPSTQPPSVDEGVDFVIITALEEERDAVLSKLPDHQQLAPTEEDIRVYYSAQLPVTFSDGSPGVYTVIVMSLLGMGRVEAAAAAGDAIRKWNPRYVILIGIAGGVVESSVKLGDVLVSDQIVDYELQKITPEGPEIRWEVFRADPRMLGSARSLQDDSWQDLVTVDRPGDGVPICHIGPIASGDKVIASQQMLVRYRHIWPKLIGVEMEAAGVATAVHQPVSQPGVFMVRGVSDLADGEKSSPQMERWRAYACDVAAAYAIALLKSGSIVARETFSSIESLIPLQRPPRAAHFINRERELAQLLTDLQPGRVVTLRGPGGIGKTALAAEVVWTLAPANEPPDRFPDGIVFHSFYNQPQAVLALEHIAASFGEEPRPTHYDAAQRALANRRALLILDGTENADDLGAVLAVRGGCGVLITSRTHQDAVAEPHDVKPLSTDDAVALLRKWGGDQAADTEAARQICEIIGHLPLAVYIAGCYLTQTGKTAAEYLAWLQEAPLDVLDRGQWRMESVSVLLEKSLAQVSEMAYRVLAVVGVLAPAPFDRAPLAAALDLSLSQLRKPLDELVSQGLLTRSEERYNVSHALVLTYVRERVQPETVTVKRLAEYYTMLAETESVKGLSGYRRLDAKRPHLMRVLASCAEGEQWETVRSLVWAVEGYLDLQGYWMERVQALEIGIRAAQELAYRPDECAFLGNLGNAYRALGQVEADEDHPGAINYYEKALAIAQEIGDRRNEGIHLGSLGLAYAALGQVERAIKYYEQALAIAQEIGDRRNEGIHLGSLGLAYAALGQVERAIEYYEQALLISHEIGDRRGEGNHWGNLGLAYHDLGQAERAIEYYQQSLVIAREISDRRAEGTFLGNLGLAYADLGQVERAIEYYQQALTIVREIGDRRNEGTWLGNLGLAYAALGQVERAIEYYQQALAIAQEIGDRRNKGTWLSNLGLAYSNLGRMERAIEYYQQALTIAQEIGDRRGEGNRLGNLGAVCYRLGQVERAIEYYRQALAISREIGDRRGEGFDLGNLGNAYAALGQVERASDFYRQALVIAREIGDLRNEGAWLSNLGNAYAVLGQVKWAIDFYQQALAISQEIGDRRGEGAVLGNLGKIYRDLGKMEQAIENLEQALTIARKIGDRRGEGNRLDNLANTYAALGQVEQAIEYHQQALTIVREIGDQRGEADYLANLGDFYNSLDQRKKAIGCYELALAIAREIQDRDGVRRNLSSLALLYHAIGDISQSIVCYRQLADAYRDDEHLSQAAETLISVGNLARDNELFDQAKQFWLESKDIYLQIKSPLASSVDALLNDLESIWSVSFSLMETAQSFLKAAGFKLSFEDEGTTFLCQPKHRDWRNKFSKPIPVEVVSGTPLDREQVHSLFQSACQMLNDRPDTIFVIFDDVIKTSGMLEIATLRAEDVQVIPIDDSRLLEGQETKRQRQVLRTHLIRFLGKDRDLYNVRTPVSDKLNFFGRETLASELTEDMIAGQPVALFGLRKMGKSSLLKFLRDKLPVPTALANLQKAATQKGIDLTALYGRILISWSKSAQVKIRDLDWSPPALPTASDPSSAFVLATRSLLTCLEKSDIPPQLCLLLDEADLIAPRNDQGVERYLTFSRTLRGLVEEEECFSLLIAGVDPGFIRTIRIAGQQNPFYQFFREVYLPTLHREDCLHMIRNIGSQMGLDYSDEAVKFVADVTGGHPFLARQLCSLAFQRLGKPGDVPLSHLQEITDSFIREPGTCEHLDRNGLWGEVTNPHLWPSAQVVENQTILRSLAQVEPQPEANLMAQAQSRQACEHSLVELGRRDVLGKPETTLFDIKLQIFRSWIRRYELKDGVSV